MKTILVYGLKNTIGGIESYLMMMHKYLHEALQFVFLVEQADDFIYRDAIATNNGIIEFLPERHSIGAYTDRFRKLLRQYSGRTNILYVNVGHISFDIVPIQLALKEGYRVIAHSHSAMQEPIRQFRYRFRQDILRTIAMLRLKHANVERVAVSDRAGRYLFRGKPYTIISPGIEVGRFAFDPQTRAGIRERLGLKNTVVMGFVGRLAAVKNPLFLIDILRTVKQSIPNARLLVVGDGDLMNEMADRAGKLGVSDDVVFVGEVKNVEDYYQAMDVLLAPSFSEGMPLGIMEAQSAGVPCICAKGNFPETIDVTGLVRFCSLDEGPTGWSEAVQALCAMDIDRTEMKKTVAGTPFNIEMASRRLLDVLER